MILYIAREIRILMDLQENSRLFHNANEDYYNIITMCIYYPERVLYESSVMFQHWKFAYKQFYLMKNYSKLIGNICHPQSDIDFAKDQRGVVAVLLMMISIVLINFLIIFC